MDRLRGSGHGLIEHSILVCISRPSRSEPENCLRLLGEDYFGGFDLEITAGTWIMIRLGMYFLYARGRSNLRETELAQARGPKAASQNT
jgi:hypothetical protein